MSDLTAGQAGVARVQDVQAAYMAMTRRKRLYGSVMLIVFIALMVSGFQVADGRNAGGFWDGIGNIFQFPGEVLAEAATDDDNPAAGSNDAIIHADLDMQAVARARNAIPSLRTDADFS